MSGADIYKAKAEELLRTAAATENLAERSRLISEAVRWHMMASPSLTPSDAVTQLDDSGRVPEPDPWDGEAP